MEKRKRKETKKSRKLDLKRNMSIDTRRNLKFLGIDNCISIYLSPQTQRFIGCQIGENITAEQPWMYVKKEKIEDTLFLHENSSEFLPLRNLIEDYPEDTMLIGSYRTNQEKTEEFLICTTIDAKDKILELLEKEKLAIIEKVKQLIYCQPNKWNSLGSEVEVNESQNVNKRNLFEVIFDSKTPITIGFKNVKFKYRLASVDSNCHTYEEILPDRRFYKALIFKIRVDRASQISPARKNVEMQTIVTFPTNKYTDTNEVFLVLTLTEPENEKLKDGLNELLKFMEDTLLVNFHINLYQNDYEFPNSYIQSYARESKELMNFQDVIHCKDLCYGSLSWNALISGLIVVSYVERPRKLIVKENYLTMKKRTSTRSVHDDNMVLLWCYSDNLSPKLYIHVNFEITSICFCPFDENILVGGGSTGQIVVWDLKNKLKQVESKEYLTSIELNHRNQVRAHTTWMKWPPGVRHVFPTIISNMNVSHKSPVISIQWLPSYQILTKLGQVDNVPVQEGRKTYLQPAKSYQFLTCSTEDSCVLAWEINPSSHMLKPEHSAKKKTKRLARLPESLIEGISPLKRYNKNFQPFFKLKLELPGAKDKLIIVTDLILNNPEIQYTTLNPKTLDNLRERTFFKEIVPIKCKPHTQKFAFCSTSGYLAECTWSANNFDQGQNVNEQVCDTKVFLAIHDGPVLSCRSNRFYPECILTVGGSVFGVWITSANRKPIFWRKGSCRYVSGLWSLQYPLICLVLREDNYMEYWDLVDSSVKPLRKTKIKGNQIIDLIADGTRSHARKKTYLLTDIKGAIRVQDRAVFNALVSYEKMRAITVNVLNNMLMRKQHVENLNDRLKKEYNFSGIYISATPTPGGGIEGKQPNIAAKSEIFDNRKHQNLIHATKWQRKEEMRMYETLLQKKRIDMVELEQNTIPLMEKLNERLKQQKRIDQRLALKEEIFDNQKKFILETTNIIRRQKITISFPIEMEKIVKEKYLEDYKLIEKQTLANIGIAARRATVNWRAVLGRRKTEFASIRRITQIMTVNETISSDPFNMERKKTITILD